MFGWILDLQSIPHKLNDNGAAAMSLSNSMENDEFFCLHTTNMTAVSGCCNLRIISTPNKVARSLHFWGQIFNNALCFSLYLAFVFFVYLTTLMTIWPQKCSDLATLTPNFIRWPIWRKPVLNLNPISRCTRLQRTFSQLGWTHRAWKKWMLRFVRVYSLIAFLKQIQRCLILQGVSKKR